MYSYLSKNYNNLSSAGNKAKTDIEDIMSGCNFKNIGLARTVSSNKIYGYFRTFFGVVKSVFSMHRGDIVVLQYPFKKYFEFLCKAARFNNAKVITVIHDLGSFRRKKLTLEKEIRRLSGSDFIIAHNSSMKKFLEENGCKVKINCLQIFDYLSSSGINGKKTVQRPFKVVYAGTLNYKKNRFVYNVGNYIKSYILVLYGRGLEKEHFNFTSKIDFRGFIASDKMISENDGDFGLVWDGNSSDTCGGDYGIYLKYNNPHKASFYLRSGMPLIVWSQSALAEFVIDNKIGFCIDKITDIDDILEKMTDEEYNVMKVNACRMSVLLNSGHYIKQAINEGIDYLTTGN